MTSLEAIRLKLVARINTLDLAFDRHVVSPVCKTRTDRFALQEGLLSSLWQSWCWFCRETLIGSAQGITTKSGHQTSSRYAGMSEMEVAFVARELSQNRSVQNVRPLSARRLEPTWGDLNKVNLIATGIASSNSGDLTRGFGVALTILDLQLCRNASAHINPETLAGVNAARVRYSQTSVSHPSDVMFWVDPATKDFLWKTWIDEITIVSDYAIN